MEEDFDQEEFEILQDEKENSEESTSRNRKRYMSKKESTTMTKKRKNDDINDKVFLTPLPIDGKFETWLNFGSMREYGLSLPLWGEVVDWVKKMREDRVRMAEHIAFHHLIAEMKSDLGIKSSRDHWGDVLPNKYEANYFWTTLMLMIATPAVPDSKIIEVFGPLFKQNYVTEQWTINMGKQKLQSILKPLGRQNMSADYILEAAQTIQQLRLRGIDPRDHRLITQCKGVGYKVALVTTQEAFGFAQGIPCDVHMCRMFTLLGWVPSFGTRKETSTSLAERLANKGKKDKESYNYEAVRAAIEGWFPYEYWAELNQTWAGLGQLLNLEESRRLIVNYIDNETSKIKNKKWRQVDRDRFGILLDYYIGLKNA